MKHQSKPISISCFLFLLVLFSHFISITAQEVEDEREFDYLEGSEKGPHHWGELHEEWSACNNGSLQSPIDLSNERVKMVRSLGKLKRRYKASNATVKNRGHDIMVEWKDQGTAGYIEINGTQYLLVQCHWHSPSEHSINGRSYDMELHMVHLSPDPKLTNKILVIGLLYKIGRPDAFISKLMTDVKSMTDKKEEISAGVIDPRKIKMGGNNYYRYLGSLTVPPCTEGVIWIIHKKIRTVSREQVNLFRVAVHDVSGLINSVPSPIYGIYLTTQVLDQTKQLNKFWNKQLL